MERIYHSHWSWIEKAGVALGLIGLSAILYYLVYLVLGEGSGMAKYFLIHFAFLPIHALVLSVILEEILSLREKRNQRKKLNFFLGTFFRQMGVDFSVKMMELVQNREELEKVITVQPHWTKKRFNAARQDLGVLPLKISTDPDELTGILHILLERETEIIDLTRNPNLWEYEHLYRALISLFHLVEEKRFHGDFAVARPGVMEHLAEDVGKALRYLLRLWLVYLEYLKGEHPILFKFQMGVHNLVEPAVLEDDWKD